MILLLLLPAAYNYAVGAVDKAAGEQAAGQSETMNISIGVLKGPSGIGIIKLVAELKTLPQNVSLDYMIVADPLEMLTRLTSGELQAGLLPLNVAAKLYTKGSGYPLAAIPGLGALYILSRDSSINDWQDLAGKTVYAHGKGATPDYLFHYFLNVKGIDSESVFLNFSIPAPQLAPMAAAGKVDTVLLPQPFVSLVMMKSPDMTIRLDLQKTWMEVQGASMPYPITAFVVSPQLAAKRPKAWTALMDAYSQSISWVLANPDQAAALVDKHGILAAGPAKMAIPDCGLVFIPAHKARPEVEASLQVLLDADPISVGGALPDDGFYLAP